MIAEKQRDVTIDIVKGLGIFCMVAGHSGWPYTHFVYLFHMAIFFMASGYCYKESYSKDIKGVVRFIKRKLVTLWLPFVLWTAIYSLLHNFFLDMNIYTNDPTIFQYASGSNTVLMDYWNFETIFKNIVHSLIFLGGTQLGGAFWFLGTLMELSVGYCVVDAILNAIFKRNFRIVFILQCVISALFLAMGFTCFLTGHALKGIAKVLSFYILFHGGFALKKYGLSSKSRTFICNVIIFVVSFVVLLVCNRKGSIELGANSYMNPVFLLINSFAGWQFLYEIALLIQRIPYVKKLFVCMGQNTMAVVIFHFLSFKIVNYIGALIFKFPLCTVAAFPFLFYGGHWWIAYVLVGLFVPIIISIAWKKLSLDLRALKC